MKYLLAILCSFVFFKAYADQIFTDFEDYYRQLHGMVFLKALEDPNEGYSIQGEHGLCGEEDACQDYNGTLGSKIIKITVSLTKGGFQINDRSFYYRNAGTIDGIKTTSEEIPLHGISVYIAPKIKSRPDMVCIEGYYMGSGRFRNTEVFLVINPLGSKNRTQFLHLPSLHSSCLAVQQEPDGSISYPSNSYIPGGDAKQSTGLLMKYFALKNGVSRPLNHEIRLRFIEVGNPFKFSTK